jgi:hypothetical protein
MSDDHNSTDPEFVPIESTNPAQNSSPDAEIGMYAAVHERFPNSFYLSFGKVGHISWHSESSAAVLSLIMLIIVCVLIFLVILISAFTGERTWFASILQLLGNGMAAIIGAVVGSSASSGRPRR